MSYISDPKRHHVLNLLNSSGGSQFVIPVYQRNYVWEPNKEVKDLIKDIEKVLEDPKYSHFIGIIIYLQTSGGTLSSKKFYVIDGQQRLTTIFLLLYAIMHICLEKGLNDMAKEILNLYLTNPYIKNDTLKMKLKPLMNDSDIYEKIAENKLNSLSKVERTSNIAKSYFFIRKEIERLMKRFSLEAILESINRLYLIDFPLGPNDNAHQIYESINAKGSKLLAVDLIRNFVLMNIEEEKKEILFEEKWYPIEDKFSDNIRLENFLRFFLINRTRDFIAKKNVYNEFQNWYFSRISVADMSTILEEINIFSDYYLNLYYTNLSDIDSKIRNTIREFRFISSDMPAAIMLEAYSMYCNNEIDYKDFNEFTNLIISFIVRRAIIGLDTSGITRFFSTLIKKINEIKEMNKTSFLEASKMVIVNMNVNVASRMPTDNEIRDNLEHINVYSYRDALRWVFDKIENQNNPIMIDTKKLQIEHLLPQSSKKWIGELGISQEDYEYHMNRLGNLTFATQADNGAMSNNLFEFKKNILKDTAHLKLNMYILNLKSWNVEQINKRTIMLIDKIIELYPYYYSREFNTKEKTVEKQKNLPRMKELIDMDVIKKGDILYLTSHPNGSDAKLIDDKFVEYKGEVMTLNQWGQRVTGWKSIRIYAYTSIKGDNETLHDKRLKYISKEKVEMNGK